MTLFLLGYSRPSCLYLLKHASVLLGRIDNSIALPLSCSRCDNFTSRRQSSFPQRRMPSAMPETHQIFKVPFTCYQQPPPPAFSLASYRPLTVEFLSMSCVFSRQPECAYPRSHLSRRMCKGVAVMRRRSDSWLNATQILKVAGFDKPQRTRVLEREIQKGEHEKVQGGYGKYQGVY